MVVSRWKIKPKNIGAPMWTEPTLHVRMARPHQTTAQITGKFSKTFTFLITAQMNTRPAKQGHRSFTCCVIRGLASQSLLSRPTVHLQSPRGWRPLCWERRPPFRDTPKPPCPYCCTSKKQGPPVEHCAFTGPSLCGKENLT